MLETAAAIDAAGAWAGAVSGEAKKIRPLRGSHLFFRRARADKRLHYRAAPVG